MSFTYRAYYQYSKESRISGAAKGIISEIETINPVSAGDFVKAPVGSGFVKVKKVVHSRDFSWLLVCNVTDDERTELNEVPTISDRENLPTRQ